MVVPDSVKEKVGELPDISGMSKVRPVESVLQSLEAKLELKIGYPN